MTARDEISWVLVTNDDGCDSPGLVPLMRELLARSEVSALVPEREYSWSSKTMSRFGELEYTPRERESIPFFTANGSPADCANLGIHKLKPSRPSLLVSGINIGANAGLAYLLSSGTIGAAVEGMLSGIPAVALSLQLHREDYRDWRTNRNPDRLGNTFCRAAAVAAENRRRGTGRWSALRSFHSFGKHAARGNPGQPEALRWSHRLPLRILLPRNWERGLRLWFR